MSHLNFAEGGNRFLEIPKIKRSLHLCGQGTGEGGKHPPLPPEPPVPPPSHNQLLATHPFTLQYISLCPWQPRPGAHATPLTPPRTHTHTHTHSAHTHRSHATTPTQGPPPLPPSVFCLALDFLFNMQVFPQGRGRSGI